MATQTATRPESDQTVEKLRQLYADAPEYAKKALENTIKDLASTATQPRSRMESAGRTGWRQGRRVWPHQPRWLRADHQKERR